jgi:3-dehydroquinate dehydratase
VEDIRAQQNHFVVFVCFLSELHNPHVSPEVYVLPSNALRDAVVHEKLVELHLSDLGERLHAREAWHQLSPTPAA